MMRLTELAATKKFLPKGVEHSSAAPRRGKAACRGNFLKKLSGEDLFFLRAHDKQPNGSVLKICSQWALSFVLRKTT
jgi:hypothetical protein